MKKSALKKLISKGYSSYQIADHFDKGQTTIRYWLQKYKLKTKLKVGRKATNQRIKKFCIHCLQQLTFSQIQHQTKFCSIDCHKNYRTEHYVFEWKLGNRSGITSKKHFSLSIHIRRYIFTKYKNKCTKCGWAKINPYSKKGLPALNIDHIDGNVENTKEENLILLCPNCHALTPTFGALNKGQGKRRDKYPPLTPRTPISEQGNRM